MAKYRTDFIFNDLLNALTWMDESLQAHFSAAGYPKMSRTKSLIMLAISDGLERPNQIAQKLGVTRQGVHLALKELEADGLLSMQDDPHDRRAKRVVFSRDDQRDEMRRFAYAALQRIENELAQRVGRRQFETFRKVLQADWGDCVTPDRDA